MARRLAAFLLPFLVLAGCMGGGDGDETTSSSSSSSPSPMTGQATAVEILSAPATAPAGGKATVCFTASGSGRVPHVAIHWDDVTHAAEAERTFSDYDMGLSYPNNRTTPDPNGYELQPTGTRFCTAATMPDSGSIYVVAHAMDADSSPGDLTTERRIDTGSVLTSSSLTTTSGTSTGPPPDIVIDNFVYQPAAFQAQAGETVTVRNDDSTVHTLTGNGFDTGDIPPGGTRSFVAPAAPGSYTFSCTHHPSMQGTLTVTA